MNPTAEQIQIANHWLDERIQSHKKIGMFVVMPVALREAIASGVDFSEIFAQRGIGVNGVDLLPNFFEMSLRKRWPSSFVPVAAGKTWGKPDNHHNE